MNKEAPAVLTVQATVHDWIHGYAKWLSQHPAILQANQSQNGSAASANAAQSHLFTLRTPYLDYFAPSGKSEYSSTNVTANIEFIKGLPKSAHTPDPAADGTQPTLAEYLQIFPELAPYKANILAHNRPVLLAVCDYAKAACKQQHDALQAFTKHSAGLKIQVVEVKLLRTAQ